MIIKPYEETKKLRYFRTLFTRIDPDEDHQRYYNSLKRGEEGERHFS